MTARDFLSRAYKIDLRINSKREQIERLNALATKCTSTITGMPHNPSPSISPMADAVCQIIDLENEIARDLQELIRVKKEIVDTIRNVVNLEYQTLLEMRYIGEATWEEIAVNMHYSSKWLHRIHEGALAAVEKIINNKSVPESSL
jgi:DNA-directed RNA polymerase specialized sigma subunit